MFTIYPLWIVIGFILYCCFCRQVIEGTQTLKKMEEQDTMNERPTKDIKITDCGVLQFQFWERGSLCIQMNPPDTGVGREGGGVGGGLLLIWTWITVLVIQIWNNTLLWSKFHIIWHQTKDSLWCYSVLVYIIKFCILKIIFIKSQYWWNNWLRYFFLQEDFCEIEQIIKYNNSNICSSFLRETKLCLQFWTCILHKVYDKDHMEKNFNFYLVISPCTQSQSFFLT